METCLTPVSGSEDNPGFLAGGGGIISSSSDSEYDRLAELIKKKITAVMADAKVRVTNESEQHAGHAGSSGYAVSHIKVTVVSEGFSGMDRLLRQRLMHQILGNEIAMVHSVSFLLNTDNEAREVK
ncbi:MAG: BolA family protein [Anaplasma sp.]